jgi:glutaminyl-tRNA synthetase
LKLELFPADVADWTGRFFPVLFFGLIQTCGMLEVMSDHAINPESNPESKRRISPNFITPNFITNVIDRDLEQQRYGQVVTRFPPNPNGFAHLGHAFASLLNFGISQDYGGRFVLRMDDTNPKTDQPEYVTAIAESLQWLGLDWGNEISYASGYFPELHASAIRLIERGLAYVDSVSPAEMSRLRGTASIPGQPSQYRDRSVAENLEMFARMKAGEFPDGTHVLRAKIDLENPNFKLRDPVLYRIVHATHYRTGDDWCIYPSYDFAQAITDALDGVTHSLCSLEFIDNNAVYKWLMQYLWTDEGRGEPPVQYEFGRRSLEYTVVSKRKLRKLVEGHFVNGWDDPRMPTIAAQRRRGVTPEAIRIFASGVGVNRTNRTVDLALLENAIRDDLNHRAPRVMAVLKPLKVVIENLENSQLLEVPYWPHDVVRESPDGLVALPSGERVAPEKATRAVELTREILIEQDDFAANPQPGFKRLTVGGKVRLRGAGVIQCESFTANDAGEILELRCTLLPETEKANAVIHWLNSSAVPAEFRLYDRLFKVAHPEAEARELEEEDVDDGEPVADFLSFLNPHSLEITHGFVEASITNDPLETRYQFERLGYFWRDPVDSSSEKLVFNRIITLRDSWSEKVEPTETRKSKSDKPQVQRERELGPEEKIILEQFKSKGVSENEASVLAREPKLAAYLESAAKHGPITALSSWVVNDLGGLLREGEIKVTPAGLVGLVQLVSDGSITRRIAQDVLTESLETGEDPSELVARKGLKIVSDIGELEAILEGLMTQFVDKVAAYRAGRTGMAGFFVGQVMQATKGAGNPQVVQELVNKKLAG